jgi:hypothetical protein
MFMWLAQHDCAIIIFADAVVVIIAGEGVLSSSPAGQP